jgi:deazaflavin-dependent oxidoreductase (nitroreductase family)
MTKLPHIDPNGARLRRRFLVPLFDTPAGLWYLTTLAPKIDATVTTRTKGWLSSVPGGSLLLMTHIGAKSGLPRTTPLLYFSRGDDVVVMASNYGRASHPAWLANVRANPGVTLTFRGRTGRYRARVAQGAERAQLWAAAKAYVRNYASYEEAALSREIQIVVCEYSGDTG